MKKLSTLLLLLAIYCSASAQSVNFTGTVTNIKTEPIEGATVSLLNTNYSTVTTGKGVFAFKNVPAGQYILRVSSVAYASVNKNIIISARAQ